MVPSLAVWYPALVKLRSLVPENLHVRISDLVFLRSRGTKLRFLAEFGGAKPPILEEGRCHIADLVRERWIPVHRAVGLWLWPPCRRRQMNRRGRRAALPRVECAVDPLYVVQWVIDVLDETRREAWRGCEG